MKYLTPFALALVLGGCAHKCDCAPVEAAVVEETVIEVEEEVVEVEAAAEEVVIEAEVEVEEPVVEIATVAEPAEVVERTETMVIETEGSTGRRVVTRRLVDEIEAGTPTAPAMEGSAATDPLLSETPRVLEDETFETTGTQTTVTTLVDEVVEEVTEAVDGE